MEPDFIRAGKFEKDMCGYGIEKREQKIGIYKHIIQEYYSDKFSWEQLKTIAERMDIKYDTVCDVYGKPGEYYINAQFYPIK